MPNSPQIAKDTVQVQSSQFPLAFSLDKVTNGGKWYGFENQNV